MSHSSNPEAQRLFDQAMHAFHDGTLQDVPLLQKAVELDPNFGGAYLRLWYLGGAGFEDSLGARSHVREHADEYHRRVIALEATLSPRDQAFLDWLEDPTREGTLPKLAAYLTRYPDDDWARQSLVYLQPDSTTARQSLDAWIARDPTCVPLLVAKASQLEGDGRRDDEMKLLEHCLAVVPHAVQCMALHAYMIEAKGDCAAAESVVRSWLELQPDSLVAPSLLAGILAAEGAPRRPCARRSAAIRGRP